MQLSGHRSLKLGAVAQDAFIHWMSPVATCHPPRLDVNGWDVLVELDADREQPTSHDRSLGVQQVLVQVKATRDLRKRSIRLKLSQWETLVKSHVASLFVILADSKGLFEPPQHAWIVPITGAVIEQCLRAMREASARSQPLQRSFLTLNWNDAEHGVDPSPEGIRQSIVSLARNGVALDGQHKAEARSLVGYDEAPYLVRVDIDRGYDRALALSALGWPAPELKGHVAVAESRFGIVMPSDNFPPSYGTLEFKTEMIEQDLCELVLAIRGEEPLHLSGDLRHTALLVGRDSEFQGFRFSHRYFEFLNVPFENKVRFEISSSIWSGNLDLVIAREAASAMLLCQRAASRSEAVTWVLKPGGDGTLTFTGEPNPETIRLCKIIVAADQIARRRGMDRKLQVAMHELIRDSADILRLAALLEGAEMCFTVCIDRRGPELGSMVAVPLFALARVGNRGFAGLFTASGPCKYLPRQSSGESSCTSDAPGDRDCLLRVEAAHAKLEQFFTSSVEEPRFIGVREAAVGLVRKYRQRTSSTLLLPDDAVSEFARIMESAWEEVYREPISGS